MKSRNLRKTLGAAALVGAVFADAPVQADPAGGFGAGNGMGTGTGNGMGMMSGSGSGFGMGPGMMGRHGPGPDLKLSAEQIGKIAKSEESGRRRQWELMERMNEEQARMNGLYSSDKRDDAAIGKAYRAMAELRHEMFDVSLATQKKIDDVLTEEQRAKLRQGR